MNYKLAKEHVNFLDRTVRFILNSNCSLFTDAIPTLELIQNVLIKCINITINEIIICINLIKKQG